MSASRLMHSPRRLLVERLEQRLPMCAGPLTMQPSIEMSAYEQEMLEWINRTRADPAGEAARHGISLNEGLPPGTLGAEARQPVAPSALLNGVSVAHSNDMIQRKFFGHNNPEGQGPVERATAAGYYTTFVGENISAKAPLPITEAAQTLHTNLFLSSGHRVNTLLADYREIGLGLRHGAIKFTDGQTLVGSIVTQTFGGGYPNQVYVTGVAYQDSIDNGVYDAGEGRGGVIVEARDAQGRRFATTTGSSGGYSLRLDAGTYRILVFNADRSRMLDLGAVDVSDFNVKVDVSVGDLDAGLVATDTIVVAGSDQTWSMAGPNVNLIDVCRIDIRGTGDNVLQVDVTTLRDAMNRHALLVLADPGDTVLFDAGWKLDSLRIYQGSLVRRFENGSTYLDLMGPSDLTNPIDAFDVNANGSVSSTDALVIINELAARRYSVAEGGWIREVTSVDLVSLQQFDVSNDGRITSLDALRVINEITRRANLGLASGEQIIAPWSAPRSNSMAFFEKETAEEDVSGALDVMQGIARSDRVAVALAGQLGQAISSPGLDAIDVLEWNSTIPAELVDLAIDKWAWTDWAE